MALTALGLFAMLMLVIGACRRRIQLARIGDSGNRRGWRPDGTLEWWALALADVGYLLVGVGAPAAALAGLAHCVSPTICWFMRLGSRLRWWASG